MTVYKQSQSLDDWAKMFYDVYGLSQNYSKTPFEIHVHLTEVAGGLGRLLLRKRDQKGGKEFAAKTFAWAMALTARVKPNYFQLSDALLRKFPGRCPYCLEIPCECWKKEKPALSEEQVKDAYYKIAATPSRSLNDFQVMFQRIYGDSWKGHKSIIEFIMSRLFEEISELAESIRFYHLYPDNFDNELADLLAWWFALVSNLHHLDPNAVPVMAETLLWTVYPGHCPVCGLKRCLCRPGPVRELISKPTPGDSAMLDRLTMLYNQSAYLEELDNIVKKVEPITYPVALARIDLDDFKKINDQYSHAAGDQALKHLANTIRQKIGERDRGYRAGGDEFSIVFPDASKEEAYGVMRRIVDELRRRPVRWVDGVGTAVEFQISVSVGVAESMKHEDMVSVDGRADAAAMISKNKGKDQITVEC